MDKQKFINYKNELIERSEMYYDWASMNEDKHEQKKELEISIEIRRIADRLNQLIYNN